jgi:cysteine-rich repeat protein
VLDASGVLIDPACGAAAVRVRGSSIVAAWGACGSHARLRMRAHATADCSLLRGVVSAKGERASRFRAATSTCGDGIVDPGSGERCDDGNFLDGDACDATCGRCSDPATLTSTWAAIESAVIARYGCATCHGATPTAGLDLRPPDAYDAIVGVPVASMPGLLQIRPGDRTTSFVWLKLAHGTLGDAYAEVPGAGMPIGGRVTPDEVEAVGRWIDAGAPRDGVVAGTDALRAACGSGS